MKFFTTLAIAALLGNEVAAVKLNKDEKEQISKTYESTYTQKFDHYNKMATKDLFKLVQEKTSQEIKKKDNVTDAVAADAESKAIEKIVSQRIWDRIAYDGYPAYPYYYPNYYHYPGDIAAKVAAITAYHDVIERAAAINAIAGMVAPSADMALKILQGATTPATPPPGAPEAKPKEKAAVQLSAEGVPVLIEPKLMKNEMTDADLMQRDYIIDGINGIDFVQTKSEGVPVLIEPKLMKNEMTDADLMQRDYIVDGINGIGFVQLNQLQRPIDDTVTLQVNGVPITVNPESIMRDNTMSHAHLGLDLQVGVKTEVLNLVQTGAQIANPVWNPPFNNWSVNQPSPPHDSGDTGDQDLELRDLIIDGVNGYDLVQTHASNPVVNPPFNNWSVHQPSVPHDKGLAGAEDLGQDMIVGGDPVHYSKKNANKKL